MPVPCAEELQNAWRSERLVYRAMEANDEDKNFLHSRILNDPVSIALGFPWTLKPQSLKSAADFVDGHKGRMLSVMMCLPPDEKQSSKVEGEDKAESKPVPIGFVSLWSFEKAEQNRSAMLGIGIAHPYRGQGYGEESINWCLDFAFRRANLHRVGLTCLAHNENGLRLYRRVGFVEEGKQREAIWYDRKWYDTITFSMLESEWEKLRGVASD